MELQHEMIIPNEGMPFKLFLFEGSSGNYLREKHWHTAVEIFMVIQGELFFYLNEEEYPLRQGELFIINTNEVHSIYAPEKNTTVVLQIPLEQFEGYFTAKRFLWFSQTPVRENCENLMLPQIVQRLFEVYTEKSLAYDLQSRSLYYQILYCLVKDYRQDEAEEGQVQSSKRLHALGEITSYMREHYTEDLKLSEVASVFGYSSAYLSRMFKKYVMINFKTYLQDIRIAYAYRELMNTEHSISQISYRHGFCDSRSFAKEFKKRYGILPSEARYKKIPIKVQKEFNMSKK